MTIARRAITFLTLTFGISGAASAVGLPALSEHKPVLAVLSAWITISSPGISALVCVAMFERGRRRDALGISWSLNRWWFLAYVIGFVYSIVAASVTVAAGQGRVAWPQGTLGSLALSALLVNPALQIVGALLMEEIGWRGYLYDLWRRFGFWRYSLATGALWGLWHVPGTLAFGFNYAENAKPGAIALVGLITLISPLVAHLRDRGRSVVTAAILHGSVNASEIATLWIVTPKSSAWHGDAGIGGLIPAVASLLGVMWVRARYNRL